MKFQPVAITVQTPQSLQGYGELTDEGVRSLANAAAHLGMMMLQNVGDDRTHRHHVASTRHFLASTQLKQPVADLPLPVSRASPMAQSERSNELQQEAGRQHTGLTQYNKAGGSIV